MPLKAGLLPKRVTIQNPSTARNSFGEEDVTWATFATVWASIEPLRGVEQIQVQQVQGSVSHKITMRWISGLTPKMRILFKNRIFEIESIVNVQERNEKLELSCVEKV